MRTSPKDSTSGVPRRNEAELDDPIHELQCYTVRPREWGAFQQKLPEGTAAIDEKVTQQKLTTNVRCVLSSSSWVESTVRGNAVKKWCQDMN